MNKLVSIIVPIYNVENYLEECIKSIINQTYKELDIILVNDGSTDNSFSICKKYQQIDKRIVLINQKNKGLSGARNAGLNIAKGEYIQFVDSDDYLEINAIEKAVCEIESQKVKMVMYNYYNLDNGIREFDNQFLKNKKKISKHEFWEIYCQGKWAFCVVAWNKLYKKSIFEDLRYYEGHFHEDDFLIPEILDRIDNIAVIDEPLYYYRNRQGSIINTNIDYHRLMDIIESAYNRAVYLYEEKESSAYHLSIRTLYWKLKECGELELTKEQRKKYKMYIKKVKSMKLLPNCNKVLKMQNAFFKVSPKLLFFLKDNNRLKLIKRLMKNILHKVTNPFKNILKEDCSKIILVNLPDNFNIGDHAIKCAEIDLINSSGFGKKIVEFNHADVINYLKHCKKYINKNDIFILTGGGFVGDVWIEEQKAVEILLKTYKANKIIFFPQTIFFKEEKNYKKFYMLTKKCSNLTIICREKNSLSFLKKNGLNNVLLFPDVVLSYKFNKTINSRNGKVLICMRNDVEKNIDNSIIINILKNNNIEYDLTDTLKKIGFDSANSKSIVDEKLEEFSKYSLIICDRLHAMIFAAITGTPCIAFDNISKKVSGVYEWISYLDYVKCIFMEDFNVSLVKQLKQMNCIYPYDEFYTHYNDMLELLK